MLRLVTLPACSVPQLRLILTYRRRLRPEPSHPSLVWSEAGGRSSRCFGPTRFLSGLVQADVKMPGWRDEYLAALEANQQKADVNLELVHACA